MSNERKHTEDQICVSLIDALRLIYLGKSQKAKDRVLTALALIDHLNVPSNAQQDRR